MRAATPMDEVEVIEGRSSVPSAIMLPKQSAAEAPQSRKRLRRNLSTEFYGSDAGSGYYPYYDRRAYGGRSGGRWYPSKHSHYGAGYGNPHQVPYPYGYPGSQPYYYNPPPSALSSRQLAHYPDFYPHPNPDMLGDYPFGADVDDASQPRFPGPMYPMRGRAGPHAPLYPPLRPVPRCPAQTFPPPVSQAYPDILSSGRGDYSNTSNNVCTQTKAGHDCPENCGAGPKNDLSRGVGEGRGYGECRLWADQGRSGEGTGDGHYSGAGRDRKAGSVHQRRVALHDLETVRWIQQEVWELNKELGSGLLGRLEGSLSLLERTAYQDCLGPAGGGGARRTTTAQEGQDRDQLWRCMLSLGRTVVQYGWWCRPHLGDPDSPRWTHVASSIFTHSVRSLLQVITFYLDLVHSSSSSAAAVSSQDRAPPGVGVAEEEEVCGEVSSSDDRPPRSEHASEASLCAEHQAFSGRPQREDPMPPAQPQHSSTARDSGTDMETSQPGSYYDPRAFSSVPSAGSQLSSVTVDPPEAYVPHPSTFSQHGDEGSTVYSADTYPSQPAFPVRDRYSAEREQEPAPSVVYHYQASPTKETRQSEQEEPYPDAQLSLRSQEGETVWNQGETQMGSDQPGQFGQGDCSPEASTLEQVGGDPSFPDCADAEGSTVITVSGADLDQTQVEVYYTVDGALVDALDPDTHIITATQASDEELCAENIVYAVAQLAEGDNPGGLCGGEGTVNYILSTEVEEVEDEPATQLEPQEGVAVEAGTMLGTTAAADDEDDARPPPDLTPIRKVSASATSMESNSPDTPLLQHYRMTGSSSNSGGGGETTEGAEISMGEASAVFHSHVENEEVSVYVVTVPAEHEGGVEGVEDGRGLMCSGEEVISDAAIMLSETVEVETDGTVEVSGGNEVDVGGLTPSPAENSPGHKENIDTSSYNGGKRKQPRTPPSKNKRFRQDVWYENQLDKGVKGAKWNLRSAGGSAPDVLRSPTALK